MSGVALRERLGLLDELRQIVTAMRNLAYAELQRLNRAQSAQAKAEHAILRALADTASATQAGTAPSAPTHIVWLVIGAERGFCGGFNDRLADALPDLMRRHVGSTWMIAGTRLRQRVEPLLPDAAWLVGSNGTEDAVSCVDQWMSALVSLEQSHSPAAPALRLLHHAGHGIAETPLLPMPDLPPPTPGPRPMRHLAIAELMSKLLAEMVRVGLLGALQQSLQQENHWRLGQMQRAQDYLEEAGSRLRRRYFRQRQTEITSELETLMSSLDIKGGLGLP